AKMPNWPQQVPPQAWPAFQALIAAMRDAPTYAEATAASHAWSTRISVATQQPVAVEPTTWRRVCITSQFPHGLGSLAAPRTWPCGRLRRNAAGLKGSHIGGLKPAG